MSAKKKTPVPGAPPPDQPLAPDSPFVMAGLREDNPRDFLAALGMLRLVDSLWPECRVKLAWVTKGHPILQVACELPRAWLAALCEGLRQLNSMEPHPFVHHKVIKTSLPAFRERVNAAVMHLDGQAPFASLPGWLYACYASQIHDQEDGTTNPSAFSFANGQSGKEMLRDIRELIDAEFVPERLHADLAGMPTGLRVAKSFRWHPQECRVSAYQAHDPGAKVKGDTLLDFACANVLAFFGISFFPVVDRVRRERTLGIASHDDTGHSREYFTWPIWVGALSGDAVGSMIHHVAVHGSAPRASGCWQMGIRSIYRSERMKIGKPPVVSLYFSPASNVM